MAWKVSFSMQGTTSVMCLMPRKSAGSALMILACPRHPSQKSGQVGREVDTFSSTLTSESQSYSPYCIWSSTIPSESQSYSPYCIWSKWCSPYQINLYLFHKTSQFEINYIYKYIYFFFSGIFMKILLNILKNTTLLWSQNDFWVVHKWTEYKCYLILSNTFNDWLLLCFHTFTNDREQ